jgi:Tfp pilus assembly protein PilX
VYTAEKASSLRYFINYRGNMIKGMKIMQIKEASLGPNKKIE